MSVLHVLRDVALERGIAPAPTCDLAQWAATAPSEIGVLGQEALAVTDAFFRVA